MLGELEPILRVRPGDVSFDILMGVLTIKLPKLDAFGAEPFIKDDVLLMAMMAPVRRAPSRDVVMKGGCLFGRVVEVKQWNNNGVLGVSLDVKLDSNDVKPTDWAYQGGLLVKRVPGANVAIPRLSVGTGVAVCGVAPEPEPEGAIEGLLRRLDFDGDGKISIKESKEFIAAARSRIVDGLDGLGFGDVWAALPGKLPVIDVQYRGGISAKSSIIAGITTVIKRFQERESDANRPVYVEIFGKEKLNMVGKMYDNETDKVVLRNFRDVVEEARADLNLINEGQSGWVKWVNMIDIVSTDGIKVVDSKQVEKIVKIKRGDKMGYRLMIAESATPGQVESRTPEGLYENCLLYWMVSGERVVE